MENLFIIIPARLNSTRLSNKVLKKINEKSLVQHVWEKMRNFPNVLIATDSKEVAAEVRKFKGNVILTKKTHINGTERCNEVAEKLNLKKNDIIINVQCDELNIKTDWIKDIYKELSNSKKEIITTVSTHLGTQTEKFSKNYNEDPSNVQVLLDVNNFAKNFQRSNSNVYKSLAYYNYRKKGNLKIDHHIGIYGYKAQTLQKVSKLKVSDREKMEKLEQLRWLDNNFKIKCIRTKNIHFGFSINTKDDLERLRKQNIL